MPLCYCNVLAHREVFKLSIEPFHGSDITTTTTTCCLSLSHPNNAQHSSRESEPEARLTLHKIPLVPLNAFA